MPLFVAIHKWKKEAFVTVGSKVMAALQQLPKGVTLCSSYVTDDGGWCVYQAESSKAGEPIQQFLTKAVPEMETKVKPVLQFFPPSQDLYALMLKLIAMSSK